MIELNKLLKQLQNINLGRFSKINKAYVIGDLHGDLNKFLLFLKSINIIKSSSFPIDYDSYKRTINEMKIDVINNIKFNDLSLLSNICIVQLGDIIDGHNTCDNKIKGYINNDIVIYAIINEIIEKFKNCYNCHFILIAGNHDIENIFDIYGIDNKVNGAICNTYDKYSYWAQYILNYDEVDSYDKINIVRNKLVKRRDYLQNDFDILHNMYFMVSINDQTIFSHTVFYKNVLKRLSYIKGLSIDSKNLIEYLNGIFKYCMNRIKECADGNKIDCEVFDNIINDLFKIVSTRSNINNKIRDEKDVVNISNNGHHLFVGHEIHNEFKKIKHNMFNFYVYYIDIGISKSLYDKNTLTNYYYVVIDYYDKKVSIHKCSDRKCIEF